MAKSQNPRRIELKLRVEQRVVDRLAWIELRNKKLKSRNDALLEALTTWLDHMESVYGTEPPVIVEDTTSARRGRGK